MIMSQDCQSKHLLLLGGPIQHLKVLRKAKEMGLYTIVADIACNPIVAEMADEALPYSLMDYEQLKAWCDGNKVDGILNFCVNYAIDTQRILGEYLSLPHVGNKDQVLALTNKQVFKSKCKENGIDIINEYTEEDIAEDNIIYPVIVKPSDSSGSRGICVCRSKDELLEAVSKAKKLSPTGSCLMEQYMENKQDFTVTYFIENGEPHLTRIGDRYLGRREDGLDRQCICTITPSDFTSFYLENIDGKVKNMLKSLGLMFGPVFFQGFIDGDTVRFYDPGLRFAGGEYEFLLERVTGADLIQYMIDFALGNNDDSHKIDFNDLYKLKGKRCVQLEIVAGPGKIAECSGFDEIKEIPEVAALSQKAFVGDEIKPTGDLKQRICEVALICKNDDDEIADIIKRIYSMLSIKDSNGNDMLVSKFSYKAKNN